MYDVITIGSSTVDVFAHTDKSELIKILGLQSEHEFIAYPVGSKLVIGELRFETGGGGTNTAVCLSRLGLKTAYLGKIGNDENGNKILALLKKEKIDFVGVRGKEMSGYSVILDSIEHDRTILTYKGANNNLKYNELDLKKLQTKWLYSSAMMGESYNTIKKVVVWAKKHKIKFAFNPSNYLAEKGPEFLENILKRTDLLVLNDEEATLIVGKGNPKQLAKRLHKLGPKTVVVTQGQNDVYVYDSKKTYVLTPSNKKIVEVTGAGDAFASSFLAGLIKFNDVKHALKLALVNAESVIAHIGAKNRLLRWNESMKIIKKTKFKIKTV